jgi:hypothetical protein
LKPLEVGPYGELAARPNPHGLKLTFIPALSVLAAHVEETLGAPLTRAQLEGLRDHTNVMALPQATVKHADEQRGFSDIDPARAWEEWQALRAQRRATGE